MIRINKGKEPLFWREFKERHPKLIYRQLETTETGPEVRHRIREYMLQEQYGLCCYCCQRIKADAEKSLNEHIRPEASYPEDTMDYENLLVSCQGFKHERTCGPKKDNDYDEKLFVSPLAPDCESHFRYFPNGMMEGVTEAGKYTIELLGLNHYALVQAREAVSRAYGYYGEELLQWYLDIKEGRKEPFVDIVAYLKKQGYYDISLPT